jgi:tripartite-type tricarboxylate transporter receptor subunit TctC
MTKSGRNRYVRAAARECLLVLAGVCASLVPLGAADAQPFPSRTIKLIVPYAPGGAGDVIARIVSQPLSASLGQTVVIENKPGAGGMIGAMAVASAPPDGYTVLLGNTTEMVVSPYIVKSASYETQRDFRPVALAGYLPQLLIANPSVKATTIDEFIALAKAQPGVYSYATAGTGSTAHIAGAMLERLAGIKMLSVPYKGGAQAVTDVLAGNVSIYFSGIPVSSLPNVPALATGPLARLDLTAWFGFFVPKGTPDDVVTLLHTRLRQILDTPEMQQRLVDTGVEPASMSAAQFEQFVANERTKYGRFISELAIQAEQ